MDSERRLDLNERQIWRGRNQAQAVGGIHIKALAKIAIMVLFSDMTLMRYLALTACAALFIQGAFAAEPAMTSDQIGSVERVESITLPMPGEFFAAIGKLGRPNWSQFLRSESPATTSNRNQIALVLGTLVADGYIAVEAQDSQGVKNIGREIISLAKKLNVSQSVLGRGNSLNDFAENNDWSALREELEATQNEVKLDMELQKDTSLVTLVSLGAWIRGTEIISSLVEKNYTPESAHLLHQPAIIGFLISQIDALPESFRKDPIVYAIRITLEKSLPDVTPATPTEDNTRSLSSSMQTMMAEIIPTPTEP